MALNPKIIELLDNYTITCVYSNFGCRETFNYTNLKLHKGVCKFQPINCKFCNINFAKFEWENHSLICKNLVKKCGQCGFSARNIDFVHNCAVITHFETIMKQNLEAKIREDFKFEE